MNTDFVLRLLRNHMTQGGVTPEEAAQFLEGGGLPHDLLQQALEAHRASTSKIKLLKDPPAMVERQRDWYAGPAEGDPCWSALRRYLATDQISADGALLRRKWPDEVIGNLDTASTRIVSLLAAPSEREFAVRGLVLGYVQSGKTANFTAVISKAADAGYKLFVVLSGLHNSLRAQTQKRLEDELVRLNPKLWHTLTTVQRDFVPHGNVDAFFADTSGQRVLCVMKKNSTRLRALLKWLSTGRAALAGTPMLVIDDEADQASVDTKGTESPSVINDLILKVLRSFPKSAYVAYTATPFANVLSDTSSAELLYPRDFIVDLPRPAAYFGAERLFGTPPDTQDDAPDNGLDVIRVVPASEEASLQPAGQKERAAFQPSVTESLSDAISWFWLACAARRARRQADQHMSMLVHTTVYTDVHERFGEVLEGFRSVFRDRLSNPQVKASLEARWADEVARVPATSLGESGTTFPEVWAHLRDVVLATEVVVDNAKSESRLVFPPDRGTTQIVVGGNTLSRGLTVEGLTVSFYLRTSGTYDTLLQMGRWFGYRAGYADLARIWMTADLRDNFAYLALVEQEIRRDIALYEQRNATPADFGPKIRTHSSLAITAPMKMQYAVRAEISYSEDVKYTLYLDERDGGRLRGNLEAARQLLSEASQLQQPEHAWDRHWLFRNLNVSWILKFFRAYHAHEKDRDLQSDLLVRYVQNQNDAGELLRWNVAVVGRTLEKGEEEASGWDGLLPGRRIPLLTRAKMSPKRRDDPAFLKAIMSQTDRVIDLCPTPPRPADFTGSIGWAKRAALLRSPPDQPSANHRPLLLLYAIDKDSRSASDQRAPLAAEEHFIGLGLVFPHAKTLKPVEYMTADIRHLEPEPEPLEYPVDA